MAAHILNDFIIVNCTSHQVDPKSECIHFLTHIGRHQNCLSNIISSHIKKVYTSEFNVWYLKTFFDADVSQFVAVPLWTKRKVKIKGVSVTFELLNANHCPGAVMILIKGNFGSYLYSGNCRFSAAMLDYSSLKPYTQGSKELDKLYVNAAYLKMEHNFPKRELVIQQILDFISDHGEEKIYLCCRLLGKEDILFRIALETNENIYVSQSKLRILNKLGYKSSLFTTEMSLARLRVVDVSQLTPVKMKRRKMTEKCVGIIFSGCNANEEKLKRQGVYMFPASDHSCANETRTMMKALKAKQVYLLNEESTLSHHIRHQKNIPLDDSPKISFKFLNDDKKVIKSVAKNKLSLKLNLTVRDENQPPPHHQHPPKHVTSFRLAERKALGLRQPLVKDNTQTTNKKKGSTKKPISITSQNYSDKRIKSKPAFEDSFVFDENSHTGFNSSSEKAPNKRNDASPSFPPSVSNIILTDMTSLPESSNDLSGGESCLARKPPLKDTAGRDLEVPSDTEQSPPSRSVTDDTDYNYLSPSYPPSLSSTINSIRTLHKREQRYENYRNNKTTFNKTRRPVVCDSLENNNEDLSCESSEPLSSPLNILSPSFPTSASNTHFIGVSSKHSNDNPLIITESITNSNDSEGNSKPLGNNKPKISFRQSRGKFTLKRFSSSSNKCQEGRGSLASDGEDQASIVYGSLTGDSHNLNKYTHRKSSYTPNLEVISESPASSQVGPNTDFLLEESKSDGCASCECVSMNFTKIVTKTLESQNKTGEFTNENKQNHLDSKSCQPLVVDVGSVSQLELSEKLDAPSLTNDNVMTLTDLQINSLNHSLFIADASKAISDPESAFKTDGIIDKLENFPMLEMHFPKTNNSIFKTLISQINISSNSNQVLQGTASQLQSNGDITTDSLFSIDSQNCNCCEDHLDITLFNSNQYKTKYNSKKKVASANERSSLKDKNEKALTDQTTILFSNYQVTCQVHQRPQSDQQVSLDKVLESDKHLTLPSFVQDSDTSSPPKEMSGPQKSSESWSGEASSKASNKSVKEDVSSNTRGSGDCLNSRPSQRCLRNRRRRKKQTFTSLPLVKTCTSSKSQNFDASQSKSNDESSNRISSSVLKHGKSNIFNCSNQTDVASTTPLIESEIKPDHSQYGTVDNSHCLKKRCSNSQRHQSGLIMPADSNYICHDKRSNADMFSSDTWGNISSQAAFSTITPTNKTQSPSINDNTNLTNKTQIKEPKQLNNGKSSLGSTLIKRKPFNCCLAMSQPLTLSYTIDSPECFKFKCSHFSQK